MLQHDLNCLTDENRATRKRALEKIHLYGLEQCKGSTTIIQGFLDFLLKHLLKVLSDPVEKCRELSISFFAEWVVL